MSSNRRIKLLAQFHFHLLQFYVDVISDFKGIPVALYLSECKENQTPPLKI